MNNSNAIDLLFGGMEKLGPGSDVDTRYVLGLLPKRSYRVVVDAGCGMGRQTLVLAKELGLRIQAVDLYEPFLKELSRRATDRGVAELIEPHCMDMKDIPDAFRQIDLLWSEGSAYNIGFSNALQIWASAMNPGGFLAVSEMSWMREQVPDAVREFFGSFYPDMHSMAQNIEISGRAGYDLLATHTLPRETWVEGYYDILAPRAASLLNHRDAAVRELAAGMIREIEIFELSQNSYAYVFYLLRRS
ncbi:MAG TPA: methyltransferase domain-containing protein [Acidobacteriota bacterium]|nr:methyltransferase domain-containing protein [Acidobacteriota bacterium]